MQVQPAETETLVIRIIRIIDLIIGSLVVLKETTNQPLMLHQLFTNLFVYTNLFH